MERDCAMCIHEYLSPMSDVCRECGIAMKNFEAKDYSPHLNCPKPREVETGGGVMRELNFYWRMGDYALEAVPKHLVRYSEDEPNVTIELVKFYPYEGHECKYTIGYFYYNTHEPCWELKFVGERFKDILEGDCIAIFKMLGAAYDTLEEWTRGVEDGDEQV